MGSEVYDMDVVIVGDGPGGLSAALFLAKNGQQVTVYGQDKTAMHWALLRNYLGVEEERGGDFQARARKQVTALGASIDGRRVEKVAQVDGGFETTLEDGETVRAGDGAASAIDILSTRADAGEVSE